MKFNLLFVASLAGLMAIAPSTYAARKNGKKASRATHSVRAVSTHHSVTIDGHTIGYTATAGTILLRGKHNKPTGVMFYVAYTRDGVHDLARRPVTFLYNGGPGSSSIWLHMGGLGPYRVNVTDAGSTPPAPYSITPNHESLLGNSDLVFIDAMGTGYSHTVGEGKYKMFWGVNQDVRAFGQFIERYLTKYHRWNSPKFLYGESYGTTRSAALAKWLQNNGAALNGVILQSSILNYFRSAPGSDLKYIYYLPSYAAIAWHHNKVPHKAADLPAFVKQAQAFTNGAYAMALLQGDRLPKAKRDAIVARMHQFTGLPVEYLERANLRVTPSEFRKELLLSQRKHLGRYDARYAGADKSAISSRARFDPSSKFISPAFVSAFHWYLQHVLHFKSDRLYKVSNHQAIHDWDWRRGRGASQALPYVAGDLADAMRRNPDLRVLSENGYFDLATPFHGTEYDLDHMLLPPALRKNVQFAFFRSGHMIYLNPKALSAMKKVLDRFYTHTLRIDQNGKVSK